ncbi:hypothetical protein ACF0H5_012925 [Mactra antiquata]
MRCLYCLYIFILYNFISVYGDGEEFEGYSYDGWYNNLNHPDWGAAETILQRKSAAAYSDGVYNPSGNKRPNPFDISKAVHQGPTGTSSYVGRTAMLVYFGQQIVEEIVDSQRPGCPIEYFNVDVPKGHPQFDSKQPDKSGTIKMPFKRTRYDQRTGFSPNNPRQQLNEITPFLDGQVIYGPNKAWADAIRSYENGQLASTTPNSIMTQFPPDNSIRLPFANPPVARTHKLEPVSRFHAIGNPRGHENPFLLSFGILWFRWHNNMATRIVNELRDNRTLTDEQIFNIARKRVIAQYQKIVFYDWLPVWLNTSITPEIFKRLYPYRHSGSRESTYNGYNPSIHPGIYQEFQVAAMRFGHTLIPPGLWRRTQNCELLKSTGFKGKRYAALRLCNSFWNSRESVEEDLDAIFRGLASTLTEREDSILVPDLTESLFGPLEFSRRDLAALNIQRGRDHGVADYNTVRESYNLKRKDKWQDLANDYNKKQINRLWLLYNGSNKLDDIDLFTGGMLETQPTGPGELFSSIILEQFLRIRHGDRFWFENKEQSGLTDEELEEIWNTDLFDVITSVTNAQDIQRNVFIFTEADRSGCHGQPKQLDAEGSFDDLDMLEPCTPLETYDYFDGSQISFAVTYSLVAIFIPVTVLVLYLLSVHRRKSMIMSRRLPTPLQRTSSSNMNEFRALEWIDMNQLDRVVIISLEPSECRIDVFGSKRILLRQIDVSRVARNQNGIVEVHISSDKEESSMFALKLKEYDLILKFYDRDERDRFLKQFDSFVTNNKYKLIKRELVESYILRNANTKKHRQERLDKFFRKIINMFREGDIDDVDENIYGTVGPSDSVETELTRIELTQAEFGEAFGMRANSTFVKHMFLLVDEDKSGRVSFKEFLDLFIMLSSDDAESKTRLLFNMYDITQRGYLSKDDLHEMIRSLLDMSESHVTEEMIHEFTAAVYKSANLQPGSDITYTDFKKVFTSGNCAKRLEQATLDINANDDDNDQVRNNTLTVPPPACNKMVQRRNTLYRGYSISGQSTMSGDRRRLSSMAGSDTLKYATLASKSQTSNVKVFTDLKSTIHSDGFVVLKDRITGYLETYRLQAFWLCLYCLVTIGVFLERSVFYALERENGGLRRIAGHGVTMSRGSASVIMFTYASLLVTMCKNLITKLRETVLNRIIPFDSFHSWHKFVALISLAFTILHIVCHGINLYSICTQPSMDLNCYFREYFRASHELASFHYWAFGTMTGLTGVILTLLLIVLYVFALPYARRHLFHVFWQTHKLYIIIYLLAILHGSARMVQTPHFGFYIIGPVFLFTIDKLISVSRQTSELKIVKAELLPSDVTALTVTKPPGFEYMSGQWAQIASIGLGQHEFHPFTMTSAPHEKFLKFHIRAVGPWTTNIRTLMDPGHRYTPGNQKLLLDGPFGEGHQDWYRYEVSVLIGGGIGVTPFASILKDIVHKSQMEVELKCKKVYFLWVTRTQKQFEWLTDIIRELEAVDYIGLVTTHIFVTQFKTKFDLRTSMLYICERHFQKIADKSLFTGLRATTHFGRPKFFHFLDSLRSEYRQVKRFGVFSCGPRPMTLAVEQACSKLNQFKSPTYYHHYENF